LAGLEERQPCRQQGTQHITDIQPIVRLTGLGLLLPTEAQDLPK
jgi:hypothetical protein